MVNFYGATQNSHRKKQTFFKVRIFYVYVRSQILIKEWLNNLITRYSQSSYRFNLY